MSDSTKQAKQAQKDFLEALKAIPTNGLAIDMCEVYLTGYGDGKLAGQKRRLAKACATELSAGMRT